MRYKLLVLTIVLFSAPAFTGKVSAAKIVETKVDRVYTASEDFMQIEETRTIKLLRSGYVIPAGQTETFILQPFIKDSSAKDNLKIEQMVDSTSVTDQSGAKLKFTVSREKDAAKIQVKFTTQLRYGETRTLRIKYRSFDLVNKAGRLYDIYLIPFSKDFKFGSDTEQQSYTSRLRIPKSFGEVNFAIPEVRFTSSGDFLEADIPTDKLIERFAWVQVGKKQSYDFVLQQKINRTSDNPFTKNRFEITLPRNYENYTISQKVFFEQLNPKPSEVYQDSEGNMIAVFELPANRSHEVSITGYAELIQKNNVITQGGRLTDINNSIKAAALQPAPYWEVDHPEIQSAAVRLKADESEVFRLVSKVYGDIIDKIDYSEVDRFGITERKGALSTLRGESEAVCMEYSDLFITLMRAIGVPARAAYGHGYDSRVPIDEQVGHQWAEVYLPSVNDWIGVDVTWGESGQTLIGGDLNHLYTHIATAQPEQPPQIKARFFGSNPITDNIALNVTATDKDIDTSSLISQEALLVNYHVNDQNNPLDRIIEIDNNVLRNIANVLFNNVTLTYTVRTLLYLSPILILTTLYGKEEKRRR